MSDAATTERSKVNLSWLATLRGLGTIAVIFLHVAADVVIQIHTTERTSWWIANIVDSACRLGVPIFLMISGTLLLPRIDNIGQFLKKRAKRFLLPFIFWSLVYLGYQLVVHAQNGVSIELHEYAVFAKSGISYHLWYIYSLVGIYLFMPVISTWIRNSSNRQIEYFIAIWFLVIIINAPLFDSYLPDIELGYFAGNMGLCILGYYLAYRVRDDRWTATGASMVYLGATVVTSIGTTILSHIKGSLDEYFYAILSPSVVISAIGAFLFVKKSGLTQSPVGGFLAFTSRYSYGIYLCHVLVLTELDALGVNAMFIHPLVGIPLTSIVCLALSLLIVEGIRRVPLMTAFSGYNFQGER